MIRYCAWWVSYYFNWLRGYPTYKGQHREKEFESVEANVSV